MFFLICIISVVVTFVGIIVFSLYDNWRVTKQREKAKMQIYRPEELVEVFVRWIVDDYWVREAENDYLDFTKTEMRAEIPCWQEKKRSFFKSSNEGEGSFWLGDDGEGNDLTYIVHFTQEDWARFSQLYDQHLKESDDWSNWWGERWPNLYASIVANEAVERRVYDWCHKPAEKRKKAASTYLREVLDLMRKKTPTDETKVLRLGKGQKADISEVEGRLTGMGYRRTDYVSECGKFAVRGSLVDIYPYESEWPVRIDFFGDEVDSLRTFDPISQQTKEKLEQCVVGAEGYGNEYEDGEYDVHHWYEPYEELCHKRFTTAEDMVKYMLTFFQTSFWQDSWIQEELNGDYRGILTDYFNNTRQDNPGMLLDLSDTEWKRLKRLFPKLIEEDEMRDIIKDTLEVRIGHVIDPEVGRSAKAVVVHDMLEPFA